MFKGKIKLWVGFFLMSIILNLLPNLIINVFKDNSMPINICINTNDKYMLSTCSILPNTIKLNKNIILNFNSKLETADIIVSDKELKGLETKNYKLLEKTYSPIICATSNLMLQNETFFKKTEQLVGKSSKYNVVSLSMKNLIQAIIENKTWEELNVNEFKGEIKLVVPSLSTNGGIYVWNVLYDIFKELNPNVSKEELIILTNNFYEKCEISDNIISDFYDIHNNQIKSKNLYKIWMFPEYYISSAKSCFNNRYNIALYPIYFDNTYGQEFYIYGKMDNEELINLFYENSTNIIPYYLCLRFDNKDFTEVSQSFHHIQKYITTKELSKERYEYPILYNNFNVETSKDMKE